MIINEKGELSYETFKNNKKYSKNKENREDKQQ